MSNERKKLELVIEIDKYKNWIKYSMYSVYMLIIGGLLMTAQSVAFSMMYSWYSGFGVFNGVYLLILAVVFWYLRSTTWVNKLDELESEYASL